MVTKTIQDATLTGIADAIRAKTGASAAMTPAQMAQEIENIQTGGGAQYSLHTVSFSLASSTAPALLLSQFIDECAYWRYYPTSEENTNTGTIAVGMALKTSGASTVSTQWAAKTTATGVNLMSPYLFYVNDQTYSAIRLRGNVNSIPAGEYELEFYGIAK